MPDTDTSHNTMGVIFRGGASRRLGQDKAQATLVDGTMLEKVSARLSRQCSRMVLSVATTNQIPEGWQGVQDQRAGGGPLLALPGMLKWVNDKTDCRYVLTTSVDTPFLPRDLRRRLHAALEDEGTGAAVARTDGQLHGLHALYDIVSLPEIRRIVLDEGERKLSQFHRRLGSSVVDWDGDDDPFFNVNSPDDLERARRRVGGLRP